MKKKFGSISTRTIIVFVSTLICCLLISLAVFINRTEFERLTMEALIYEKGNSVVESISDLLYRTQTLASFILQYGGDDFDFERLAPLLVADPAIFNILIAPDGIVTRVYPLEGNEAVLGLNFFEEGAGNREAVLAKELGSLVLGGPFEAVQGLDILVGRRPIFMKNAEGVEEFWGLVSVTLRHPDALKGVSHNKLYVLGYEYDIWRINPDNNQHQIIISNRPDPETSGDYVEAVFRMYEAEWFFRIYSSQAWYGYVELWLLTPASFILSFLLAMVVQHNHVLRVLKNKLTDLSNADPLTGVFNRRYFMSAVSAQMQRIDRTESESFIVMVDLDHFKSVNDKYGHQVGDIVIQETARWIEGILRPYDIFARYGGEEFVIFLSDIDKKSALHVTERIRATIEESEITQKGDSFNVTASLGIAAAAPVNDLDDAIAFADAALYKAKQEGRNRVCFAD